MSSESTYGFVGAGEITAAIVEGLSRDGAEAPAVFLSPRGRAVARGLAGRFPNVQVCGSNQEVLDNTSTVVLAVRQPQAHAVLTELSFEPRHVLVNAVAGVRMDQLRAWASPARDVVTTIPLPQAAHGQSLTVMYPDDDVARELFTRVGDVLVPRDEQTFDALSAGSGAFARSASPSTRRDRRPDRRRSGASGSVPSACGRFRVRVSGTRDSSCLSRVPPRAGPGLVIARLLRTG